MKFSKLQKLYYSLTRPKIKGLILFGVPGAGKGTYGSLIKKDWNLIKLSPGDLIRNIMKEKKIDKNEKYEKLKHCMDNGLLVEDEIVLDLVEEEYKNEIKNYNGVIFDGIPRNLKQAEILKTRFNLEKYLIINIILKKDILIEKLLGRRVCEDCGENYNICEIDKNGYFMKPLLSKKENICDCCGGNLIKRKDDKVDIIEKRIQIYENDTKPVLNQLKSNGVKCIEFEPKKGKEDYWILKKELEKYEFS